MLRTMIPVPLQAITLSDLVAQGKFSLSEVGSESGNKNQETIDYGNNVQHASQSSAEDNLAKEVNREINRLFTKTRRLILKRKNFEILRKQEIVKNKPPKREHQQKLNQDGDLRDSKKTNSKSNKKQKEAKSSAKKDRDLIDTDKLPILAKI
ncbi:hypothetical protein C1646_755453 [Rhizophagus diaphanus]|nr:hypothetical protein C1646_755453 [Rhizophagus diaphanus] [Rhizophagus sp. MUCL 43196]